MLMNSFRYSEQEELCERIPRLPSLSFFYLALPRLVLPSLNFFAKVKSFS